MFKKTLMIIIAGLFAIGVSKLSFAQMGHMEHKQQAADAVSHASKQVTDAGNQICPVSGEKINEKTKATYEYKGKIYNFCCAMCIGEFKKDPAKYIKKVHEELKAKKNNAAPASQAAEPSMPTGMHKGHQH